MIWGRTARTACSARGGRRDFSRARDIDVVDTDRGGRVTYHGPGQLVCYPIMRVPDVGFHLRTMEASIVSALAAEGVVARSRHEEGIDYTGVWVGQRKIASIGVHVSRGVSTHGFAVNVDLDLDPFSWVIACGLPDVAMTSLAEELRQRGAWGRVLSQAHGPRLLPSSRPSPAPRLAAALGIDAPPAPPPSRRVTVLA